MGEALPPGDALRPFRREDPNVHDPRSAPEPPTSDERSRLLGLLTKRARFLAVLEETLSGYPPEIREVATRKAAETDAEELLAAIRSVQGIFELPEAGNAVRTREALFRRSYAVGQLLGMDPRDPNMRLWSGEDVKAIFGL